MNTLLDKFFPIPDFLRMPAIGLDISDHTITYVELVNTNKGLGVGRFGQKKLDEGVVVKGVIENTLKLQEILTNLQHELGMHFARASVPEQLVYSFVITIPKVNYNEIRDAVEFQIEEHVPSSKRDLIFDYEILSEGVRNYRLKVHAVTKKIFESYNAVLQNSSFGLVHFESKPESIVRGVVLNDRQRYAILVDINVDHSSISIIEDGKIVSSASVDFNNKGEGNVDTLGSEIVRYYNYWRTTVPVIEKIDKEVESKNMSTPEKIKKGTENIREETSNTMYPVVISGATQGLLLSLEQMSKKIGTNIVQADIWNAPTVDDNTKFIIPKADITKYAAAIGLALSDF